METKMDITSKLKILDQIYAIYDNFAASLDLACQKYCDHCCTPNVTLTTLEGYKIIDSLSADNKTGIVRNLQTLSDLECSRPQITTNRLAQLCAEGGEPPEEVDTDSHQDCSLLVDHLCPIYDLRPFGCRCLVSRHNCGEKGYAEIDDFVLSVNTVFLQTIEHVDAGGCTGNLADILQTMLMIRNREVYVKNTLHCTSNRLIPNQPLGVLMIPPEHRIKMEPILEEIRQIRA